MRKKRVMTGLILIAAFLSMAGCTGPAFGSEAEQAGDILWVATWNIENFSRENCGLRREEAAMKKEGLIRILSEGLHCPDIIALQEVMDDSGVRDDGVTAGKGNFTDLAESLSEATGRPYLSCSCDPEDGEDGGKPGANIRTGFLYDSSRVRPDGPPEVWQSAAFTSCRKPLAVRFVRGDRVIHVINIHLTSRLGGARNEAVRLAQAREILSRLDEIRSGDRKPLILLAGDFNDTPGSGALRVLTTGFRGMRPLALCPTYEYAGAPCQLDHMLASPALASLVFRTGKLSFHSHRKLPSDHTPLMSGFHL